MPSDISLATPFHLLFCFCVSYQLWRWNLDQEFEQKKQIIEDIEKPRKLPPLGGPFKLLNTAGEWVTEEDFRGKFCFM